MVNLGEDIGIVFEMTGAGVAEPLDEPDWMTSTIQHVYCMLQSWWKYFYEV